MKRERCCWPTTGSSASAGSVWKRVGCRSKLLYVYLFLICHGSSGVEI